MYTHSDMDMLTRACVPVRAWYPYTHLQLWSLLNFVDAERFGSLEQFKQEFGLYCSPCSNAGTAKVVPSRPSQKPDVETGQLPNVMCHLTLFCDLFLRSMVFQVTELQEKLRPYMLQRLKLDVEKNLPSMEELVSAQARTRALVRTPIIHALRAHRIFLMRRKADRSVRLTGLKKPRWNQRSTPSTVQKRKRGTCTSC